MFSFEDSQKNQKEHTNTSRRPSKKKGGSNITDKAQISDIMPDIKGATESMSDFLNQNLHSINNSGNSIQV
jgi:hypothetical protein